MPPKKAELIEDENKAARFGRVKNNLKMGVVGLPNVGSYFVTYRCCVKLLAFRISYSFGECQ